MATANVSARATESNRLSTRHSTAANAVSMSCTPQKDAISDTETKKMTQSTPGASKVAGRPCTTLPSDKKALLLKQAKKDIQTQGRRHYIRFLNGERLTQREAILAKCYDCDGGHSDGRYDCEVPSCSLYPFMPYRGKISSWSLHPDGKLPASHGASNAPESTETTPAIVGPGREENSAKLRGESGLVREVRS